MWQNLCTLNPDLGEGMHLVHSIYSRKLRQEHRKKLSLKLRTDRLIVLEFSLVYDVFVLNEAYNRVMQNDALGHCGSDHVFFLVSYQDSLVLNSLNNLCFIFPLQEALSHSILGVF